MSKDSKKPPYYGAGMEWAIGLDKKCLANIDKLDCFEMIPENFFYGYRQDFLRELKRTNIPVIIHGVELSIGGTDPLKLQHLEDQLDIASKVNTVFYSEHLAMTEFNGVEIGQLTPLPFSKRSADAISRKIEQVMQQMSYPFMIENITNRFIIPNTDLTETQFINRILTNTGCGLLLDCNNIHTNATNFGYDPYKWIDEIELDRVWGIHLAGGEYDTDGTLLDSHDATVPEAVWDLFKYVCDRTTPCANIVERTSKIPEFEHIMGEVGRAQKILNDSGAEEPLALHKCAQESVEGWS